MIAKALNKVTGEQIEFEVKDLNSLMTAYSAAQEYKKLSESLKDQLKEELEKYLDDNGRSEELNGKIFKRITIQRQTYDKAILRKYLDQDTYELFMKPEKTKIDKYLVENLESLGDLSTKLRKSMVPDGNPYSQVKLEKLDRDDLQ